ncbi:MAG: hypothetical protein ACI4JX_06695 [Oscillospiraceae bacterium]
MKKITTIITALCLCSCAATSAFAAVADQSSTDALATDFTFTLKNDPVYTVTIPSEVTLEKEGTEVEIKAENVNYLDNQRISVTIAGTDKYRNQMLLEGKSETGKNASLRYQFVFDDGRIIETTGGKNQVNGVELASFTEDGSVKYKVVPVIAASSATIKGVTYTGNMTYSIALTDAE